MAEFHFLRPMWLWSLLPASLLWWGLWRHLDRTTAWRQLIDAHLLEHLVVDARHGPRLRPIHLTIVLWILSTLALAGPTFERESSPFANDQAGLMVLLKVSRTMEATDVQPSRLDRARHKLQDLLDRRQGAATGLIVYSGSAHLVMPLTRDTRIITAMAADLSPDLMPVDGDALDEALELAQSIMERAGASGSVLVLADAVSGSQGAAPDIPVQFLSIRPPGTAIDGGMREVARSRGARIIRLSIDSSDVDQVAARARSDFRAAAPEQGGERWRDAGYLLLPLLALVCLPWSRKGWVLS